ncbi:MAG TPA: hypothetical protein VLY03_01090 [Bacteroidota bacterium]|nr:hypothetical protein [Bacteroidota bacterium]
MTVREREWIQWILPAERTGYSAYRHSIERMVILGEGRRGKGEMILGYEDETVDLSAPLAPVFAYGVIETDFGLISITLREIENDQASVEIVSHRAEEIPEIFEESRRWTYSTWTPGHPCPQCVLSVREVQVHSSDVSGRSLVLAICKRDLRLWVYDSEDGVNRLIPVTNYYNELMLHKGIRDPDIALDAKRFFRELEKYSDADLARAFLTYNSMKAKVRVEGTIEQAPGEPRSLFGVIRKIFSRH